jgi:hypothetical protein
VDVYCSSLIVATKIQMCMAWWWGYYLREENEVLECLFFV